MKRNRALTLVLLAVLMTSGGCAYRYYLGMHGPSINRSPEIHTATITEDAQCLECHSPQNHSGNAPITSHPEFTGCIKCHQGPVK